MIGFCSDFGRPYGDDSLILAISAPGDTVPGVAATLPVLITQAGSVILFNISTVGDISVMATFYGDTRYSQFGSFIQVRWIFHSLYVLERGGGRWSETFVICTSFMLKVEKDNSFGRELFHVEFLIFNKEIYSIPPFLSVISVFVRDFVWFFVFVCCCCCFCFLVCLFNYHQILISLPVRWLKWWRCRWFFDWSADEIWWLDRDRSSAVCHVYGTTEMILHYIAFGSIYKD